MSDTPETSKNKLSSSATKVDDVAIEMDSLVGGDGKEVNVRKPLMKSNPTSDRVTSAGLGKLLS